MNDLENQNLIMLNETERIKAESNNAHSSNLHRFMDAYPID